MITGMFDGDDAKHLVETLGDALFTRQITEDRRVAVFGHQPGFVIAHYGPDELCLDFCGDRGEALRFAAECDQEGRWVRQSTEDLKARLDKDEEHARRLRQWAIDGQFAATLVDYILGPFGGQSPIRNISTGMSIARLADPARVLADVERTRRIIGLCETETPETGGLPLALRILRILADEPTPPPPVDGT